MSKPCVIIVGSSFLADGKRLGRDIDERKYGKIVRLNRQYGDPMDTGTQTDVWWTRWQSWIGGITPYSDTARYFVVNEHRGISEDEMGVCASEIGHQWVSIGTLACWYYVMHGYHVYYIGCGYDTYTGTWPKKRYGKVKPNGLCDGRHQDENTHYDWEKENKWLMANRKFITLL